MEKRWETSRLAALLIKMAGRTRKLYSALARTSMQMNKKSAGGAERIARAWPEDQSLDMVGTAT